MKNPDDVQEILQAMGHVSNNPSPRGAGPTPTHTDRQTRPHGHATALRSARQA